MVFIGLYETPIFPKRGWLKELDNIPADYDVDDVFKSLRDGLSYDGKLYALPFDGESTMLMYRKDLFDEKGLKMPDQPTYDDVKKFADALTDKAKGIYGITLRGKPGWGENVACITTLLNTFGATWFDMQWHPTINTPEWKKAITFYVDLMKADGPPSAPANGFNENLTLFASGKAAMWIDSTVAGGSKNKYEEASRRPINHPPDKDTKAIPCIYEQSSHQKRSGFTSVRNRHLSHC